MTTTYDRKRVNYRRIWEENFGPIPKDELGRSFHIHHIDGDHDDNSLDNLQCVSMQEHYDIHLRQGDWAACIRLARNLNRSQEEISELARLSSRRLVASGSHHLLGGEGNRKRVANGTHNLLGGEIQRRASQKRVANGTHNFLGGEIQRRTAQQQLVDGTHPFLGGENVRNRVANGTHNLLDREAARRRNQLRMANGTHQNLIEHSCPHCGRIVKGPAIVLHVKQCSTTPAQR